MTSIYKGYMGKMLDVNLTTGKVGEYQVSDTDRELFLGGRYLSTKILWDELKPGVDPLSDENILVVMTSPLTGTGGPCTSRYDISAKSPQTGAIGHSNSGGNFGMNLKRAGWDGMVVRGKADSPVYLEIEDDTVSIKKAGKIWGMDTQEAQKAMLGTGKGGSMAIGPAGENLVKFAAVVSQERCHGRTGMGAVMGSKNLKGMIARGTKSVPINDPENYKITVKKWIKLLQGHPATGVMAPRLGTAFSLMPLSVRNTLPTKNFSAGTYDKAYNISGEMLAEKHLVKNFGCISCPIRCGRVVNINGHEVKGPEYEIMCLMGSNLLIDDLEAIIHWNYEIDLLGMDTISTGTILGFAAELNEKGIWKNGIAFGDKKAMSKAIQDIAYRRGIGNDLAEGVRFLSKKYGGEDFAPHVKGLEFPAYEPRGTVSQALGYATATRGACHLDAGYEVYMEVTGPITMDQHKYRGKPPWTVLTQNLMAVISAGGNCLFTGWTFVPKPAYKVPGKPLLSKIVTAVMSNVGWLIAATVKTPPWLLKIHVPFLLPHSKALKEATGMKMDFGIWSRIGERGYNMEKLFNLREGINKEHDKLARRFTDEPLIPGKPKTVVRMDKMLPKYYRLRGWDKNGIPKKKTLKKLKLDFIDITQITK
ncbi:MAG TPA: aldehyde ferredoxin oxidoreductase family protein [Spirochaetota bacterium]|nr:aldehyde ferredoxin oxidoreductase family protein [Spirochaetota bacterium]HPG50827.1 aldehyde ferredoxin oxidoreductase family protein [Spirochaetota bacterium]HPN12237.1 aldehyde ferredoxin oxidoreductase family protein [Spirochaetota bacterium]